MGDYFNVLFKDWVAAVSVLGSLAPLACGLLGIPVVPRWMWIVVAFLGLWYGNFRLWRNEHKLRSNEHKESERFKELVIGEYVAHVQRVRAGRNLALGSEEQEFRFYREKIEADDELLKEAIRRIRRLRKT